MKKTDLVIGIVKELHEGCRCVAAVPQTVRTLVGRGHQVLVQKDAGVNAFYPNAYYEDAGARIAAGAAGLYGEADVVLKIRSPSDDPREGKHELDLMKKGATIMAFLSPTLDRRNVEKLVENKLTGFAMELIPRISRAQSMDALSSLSSVMGYRAALVAADLLGKFFPLLMTAAAGHLEKAGGQGRGF
jgi:NAD(P) transhydrogenase subunit alpha